ncbi:hypothetical protein PMM47T1_01100 [Pseudomonas sp. M47T1]|uniref:hypothetical protein n=1 Tax=unclassified Pseudomonas TaxID=196821 RepID=UPI0002607CC9|nr:hypothetical protein [Pseudomonas sp. M47T1]EIK98592.1 hypothetical protein PMM47T1_01100 [Pseudomonas sp. M47T1]
MRISLFAPAAALLGLFAINAQAANMATMANAPDSHNNQVQVHKAPHTQLQHKQVVKKAPTPKHKPQARNTQVHHDAPANR